ncbi:Ger(x)C family spore germination C-terminal domain-containing protein [Salipaludibacillus sp. CF4.18]|uniref:Ger(x)C family spore germination C-terminal domain-containing protein n=1 Tax=Salipaludibacillus sp. CF4.18 TaxID=3373081 RepID=UPI003EE63C8B
MIDISLTRGLLWFKNDIDLGTITIKPDEEDGFISALIIKAETELIPEIKNGKWKITINVICEDDVIQNTTDLDLSKVDTLRSVEKVLEDDIQNIMEATAKKVQKEMKTDVLGFGEVFRRKYPHEWAKHKDDWNKFIASIEVEYDMKVYVRRIGLETGGS